MCTAFGRDTNGVAARTVRAPPFAHDGFGQDAEWVAANFTNVAEIAAAGGYAAWVDAQVGEGLENGYYKFTVGVADDPPETVRLVVGDLSVAVTNAGEYVFLLEKGLRYAISASSDCVTNFDYSAADDVPASHGCAINVPRFLAPATEYGRWSEDKGHSVIVRPSRGAPAEGWSIWTPRLTVSPRTWRPSWSERSQTFTAIVHDVSPFVTETYRWSSRGDAKVTIDSPTEGQTVMHCDFPYEDGEMINLALTVEAMGETLQVEYRCPVGAYDSGDWEEVYEHGGSNAPPVGVAVSTNPSVVFFDAGTTTGMTANVVCHYCVREVGTMTLNFADGSNCTVKDANGAIVADGYTWLAGENTSGARCFMVTGNWESNTPSGTVFRVTYTPEAGDGTMEGAASVTFAKVTTQTQKDPEPRSRRQVGIREVVNLYVEPAPPGLTVDSDVEPGSITKDPDKTGNDALWVYKAPPTEGIDTIDFSTDNSTLLLSFAIYEPTGVVVRSCTPIYDDADGIAGAFLLQFVLQLAPTNVAFAAVETMELGLMATDAVGYFIDPSRTNWLDHAQRGANVWTPHDDGFIKDDAGLNVECPPPWGLGGSFSWTVPIFWRIHDQTSVTNYLCTARQTFELDQDGTFRVSKFGILGGCTTNRTCSIEGMQQP